MLCNVQSSNLTRNSEKPKQALSLSYSKKGKFSKKIKKNKEISKNLNNSSILTASRTLIKRNNKTLSLNHEKTPNIQLQNKIVSTQEEMTEGSFTNEISLKNQLLVNFFYVDQILEKNLIKEPDFCPKNFLNNHKISNKSRSKMVDWLIEVYKSFNFSDITFFMTLNLMDRYFSKEKKVLEIKDIHLTGVSCLFIAIKFEETNTLKLSLVTSKIAHSKLTKKQILDKEFEILEKLEFELDSPTLLNFLELILKKINLKESLEEKIYNLFVKLVMYNAVMVVHEYTLLAKWKYSLLAAGITLVAFKLLQKIQSSFNIGIYNNKIKMLLQLEEKEILETANQILVLAKNFDEIFGANNNLKKYSVDLFNELECYRNASN